MTFAHANMRCSTHVQHQENQNAEVDILQLEDFREKAKAEGFTHTSVFLSLGRQKETKFKETSEDKLW